MTFKERWNALWQRPKARYLLGIPIGGYLMFLGGMVFLIGFNASVEYSNTEEFCISCHEMRDFVYQEFKESPHFKNASGVGPTCPDCHVPKPWGAKMARKIQASFKELPGKLMGTIDTREKYEAKKLELATHVWEAMKATDSRECRNCHSLEHMDLEAQDKSARKKHTLEWEQEKGETCIDCHKGVAHELPEDYEG